MDTKQTLDVVAVGTTVGTLGEMLPPIAALFTIVWTALRIYETQTIQRMLKRDTGSDHTSYYHAWWSVDGISCCQTKSQDSYS
jgi:FtsH-binding integral membrane protein